MDRFAKIASDLTKNYYVLILANIGSIVSLFLFLKEYFFSDNPSTQVLIIFFVVSSIYMALLTKAMYIIDDNRRLKEIADIFRGINSIYRDSLFLAFHGEAPITDRESLVSLEKDTLASVCQRIAKIYMKLIKKECIATVKLLSSNNGNMYASTYVRSENDSERDKTQPKKFEVGTGQNTAFDDAIRASTTGNLTFFHSADLRKTSKNNGYNNQRPNYLNYYQSTIVVPIRCLGVEGKSIRQDKGFLCVDTKSRCTEIVFT